MNRGHSQILRAILDTVDDSGPQQLVQVRGLAGQVVGEAVRSQHFGLTSNAPNGAEGLLLAMGGGHDRAHLLGLEHPGKRPTGLPAGATTLYDGFGNRWDLTSAGAKLTDKTGNIIESKSDRVYVKPKDSTVKLYIGGDGSTGTYAVLATVSGPCMPNILGRIA